MQDMCDCDRLMPWQGPTSLTLIRFPAVWFSTTFNMWLWKKNFCQMSKMVFSKQQNRCICHNRFGYRGSSPMNSSCSKRFSGEFNESQNRTEPHGHRFQIVIMCKAGDVRNTSKKVGMMERENQSAWTVKFTITVGVKSKTTTSSVIITREKVRVRQTVKTALLSWLNMIGDLFECDCWL